MFDHRWCWGWTLKDAIKTGQMDRNSHGTITASLMVMNVAEGVDSYHAVGSSLWLMVLTVMNVLLAESRIYDERCFE